jgi:hypothetical protein
MMHKRDRAHVLDPHLLRERYAGRSVWIDPDDKDVGLLGGEFEKPEMPGMHDIEIAGNESNRLAGLTRCADCLTDLIRVRYIDQVLQKSASGSPSFDSIVSIRLINRIESMTRRLTPSQ